MRKNFNRQYSEAQYQALLKDLEIRSGAAVPFRIAETPCFFPLAYLEELAEIGKDLTRQLLSDPGYRAASLQAVPLAYRMPGTSAHPHFMTVDFGCIRTADGRVEPRLVELQAFPSLFAFQALLGEAYRENFGLGDKLDFYLGGHTEQSFWELFRRVVIGNHDPGEVALLEVHPEEQKTLPDFLLTAKHLGIAIVDATQVRVERDGGPARLYAPDGRRIRRIYNRVIVDELIQKQIKLPFNYREALDVEWAGHPNWYFQISKFSIPFLKHPNVPEAVFLDEWLGGGGSERLHGDRGDLLLKPLFSFAGKGIVFGPTDEELSAIPAGERHQYLVQERVSFAPVIETPYGGTQAEIRILYLWPDGGEMQAVLPLLRLGRGKMMGVDHNRDQKWVGASTAFWPTA